MNSSPPFEFDHWLVEPDRNALVSSDGEIRLGSRAMAVLMILANSGGRVLTRAELLEQVWQGRAVTDDVLTVAIHDLRKALGDQPNNPRFVETIQGRGYRWLVPVWPAKVRPAEVRTAEVRPAEVRTAEVQPAEVWPAEVPSPEMRPAEAPSPEMPGLASREITEPSPPRPRWGPRHRLSVAVGLTLGILGVLIFGMEQNGGQESEALPVSADRQCGINPEISEEAQKSYRLGLKAARTMTPEGFRQAAVHFETATEQAPHFSLAYASLADVLLNLSYFPGNERAELSQRARLAVQEALALDPTLPSSHLVRGIARLFLDWDLDGAEQDFWQAIQLDPSYAQAHERYALVLVAKGQYAAAEVRLRHAVELAPASRSYAMNLADLLILTDRPEEALELLDVDGWEPPLRHHGWLTRSHALSALGRDREACDAELEYLKRALPNLDLAPYRDACDEGGLTTFHALWLDTLSDSTNLLLRAAYSAELGRIEEALGFLWQMHRERDPLLIWNARNPRFEVLRDHPEYQRLLASLRPYDPSDTCSIPATSHPSWAVRAPQSSSGA